MTEVTDTKENASDLEALAKCVTVWDWFRRCTHSCLVVCVVCVVCLSVADCRLLNAEIVDGNSYPQENELTLPQFKAYFCSHNVCSAVLIRF